MSRALLKARQDEAAAEAELRIGELRYTQIVAMTGWAFGLLVLALTVTVTVAVSGADVPDSEFDRLLLPIVSSFGFLVFCFAWCVYAAVLHRRADRRWRQAVQRRLECEWSAEQAAAPRAGWGRPTVAGAAAGVTAGLVGWALKQR